MRTEPTTRAGARILVAEDDPSYGTSLERLLRRDGHQVALATDGAEAIRRICSDGEALDLVLCDLLLPSKSGFEVVQKVKELGLRVPVLVMTGVYAQAREIAALRGLGVAGYLHKSAPLDHVLFRVHSALFPSQLSQRATPRVAVSLLVECPTATGRSWATTYNLSEGGVYVRMPDPPAAGETIDLVLALPTCREPLRLQAEVMHSASVDAVEGSGYPAGFGARFVSATPLQLGAIRMLVDRMLEEERLGRTIEDADASAWSDEPSEVPVLAQICS
jgi:CheY-like chemotaxis protein